MTIQVTTNESGQRFDLLISARSGFSRSMVQKLILSGDITVNGEKIKKNDCASEGDKVIFSSPEPVKADVEPENIPLDIVYEDDSILVVNKPQGMVVHPAAGHLNDTLVSALLYHCGNSLSGIGGVLRPGIVHRIDKDTSGLIAVAKNDEAHISLSEQLADHSMHRTYYTILIGGMPDDGTIDEPIGRSLSNRKKMAVITDGNHTSKQAVTHFHTLEHLNGFSYCKVILETGRTHQIRVHMSHIGHPVLGDQLYGGTKNQFYKTHSKYFKGQCLHAGELSFRHPVTGEKMVFSCDLPENFKHILDLIYKIQ